MKPRGFVLFLLFAAAAAAQSAITVVNSASYLSPLAPDSLASVFGSNLASGTATATLDSDGNLPFELASTMVTVNGQPAALLFVSPTQINLVMPAGISAGATTLVISYTNSTATRSTAVAIATTAPGLFSSDASGRGPGAILNAISFTAAPFLVETTTNGGGVPTRLALYGTGIRRAQLVTARATDSRGNRFDLTVEYAGTAPGFFGLDQVNVVLPPELDGAGNASLTVTADGNGSNTVTAQIDLLPVSQLRLGSIALDPSFVSGGDPMTATVSLNGLARPGGFAAVLHSTTLAAQPQPAVAILAGQASVQAPVATNAVAAVQTGSIQAIAQGVTVSADFELSPVNQTQVTGFTLSASSILGGRVLSGVVTVTGIVPPPAITIQISSDSNSVRPPATIRIPFNQNSLTFPIATLPVTGEVDSTLTATVGRSSVTVKVKLLPVLMFTVDNDTVTGGTNINGTVTLGEPAPVGGAQINLNSTNPVVASPPFSITIPATVSSGSFVATTMPVTAPRTATLTATYQNYTQTVQIITTPPPTAVLDSLAVSPSSVTGGTSTQGIVTLSGPAGPGGFRVDLQSSAPATAQVPAFVTVSQGFTSAQFTIATIHVLSSQAVTITARSGTSIKTALLTVQ